MINRKCRTAVLCLGLMTFLAGNLWAAGPERQQWAEVKAKMEAEGWKQIAAGVFERQLGATKVEHLGYGPEGLAWTIGDLNRQLGVLSKEYQSYPSEDLAKVIDELSIKIANAKRELRNMPQGMSSMTAALAGASCSNICYSATADAYPLTATQGVAAVAEAKFNSTCGYSGDTYAYAYARATLNGTTTTVTQQDPDTGTNITSYASASVNGATVTGIPCTSSANSYAQSSALGISYTTSDTNNICPPVPCTVTITGSSYEYFYQAGCRTKTWSASVSGCTAPFTYQWKYNGTVVGTGSTYTRSVCPAHASFYLNLTVNGVAAPTHYVEVYYEYIDPCNPYCQ
jgi:hypothetical protein